jgi:hypothetical protein
LERGCKGGIQGLLLRQEGYAIKWNEFAGKSEDINKFTQMWDVIPSCMSFKVRKHSMRIPDVEGWPWWSLEHRESQRINGYGKEGHACVKDF